MSREFDYDKFEVKDIRDYTNEQLLAMVRNTPYVIDLLRVVYKNFDINGVYTNGVVCYDGVLHLTCIAIDAGPEPKLSMEMIDKLNCKFVPDYAEYAEYDALPDRTTLEYFPIISGSNPCVQLNDWITLLPSSDWRC